MIIFPPLKLGILILIYGSLSKGFVKLYARYLGLDHDAIVADLEIEQGVIPKSEILGSITSNEMSDAKDSSPSTSKNSLRPANKLSFQSGSCCSRSHNPFSVHIDFSNF